MPLRSTAIRRRRALITAGASGIWYALGLANPLHRSRIAPRTANSMRALRATPISEREVLLQAGKRSGLFRWHAGDFSDRLEADPHQGKFVPSALEDRTAGAWVRAGQLITPEMFGAHMGQIDHTSYVQAAIDAIVEGTTVLLAGRYTLTSELAVNYKTGFVIKGPGSIEMKDGTPVGSGYGMLYFSHCRDFRIENILADGNRSRRSSAEVPAHSYIFQSCRNFSCRKVTAVNAVCDGFFLFSAAPHDFSTHCADFKLLDCVASNSFRQGCSIIEGHRGLIRGGTYANSAGTAPMAGIDLESDISAPDGAISDIEIDDVLFDSNEGFGLLISTVGKPTRIKVTNCSFHENVKGAISWGAVSGEIFRPVISGFDERAFRGAIDIPAGSAPLDGALTAIVAPRFEAISASDLKHPLVYVHGFAYGQVWVDGMSCDRCGAIASFARDGCRFVGASITSGLGTANHAISVAGDECRLEANNIDMGVRTAILTVGRDTVIRNNKLTNLRYTDTEGAIRVLGRGAVIEGNILEGNSGVGIRMDVPPKLLRGNVLNGFDDLTVLQNQSDHAPR